MIPQYLLDSKQEEIKWIETKSEKPEKLKSERAIVHYISTIDLDRQKEIVMPKGIWTGNFKQSPSVWYNHAWKFDNNALPIAKSMWQKAEDNGMLAKTQFATTVFAEDVYMLHEGEFMNTWSIGIRPKRDKNGDVIKDAIIYDEKTGIATWNQCELLEYSSAPIASNVNAKDVIKQLLEMPFKTDLMKEGIKSFAYEVDFQEQIKSLKSDIEEIKKLKETLDELVEKSDSNEREILELSEFIRDKQEDILKAQSMVVQSILFDVEKYTVEQAKKWLKDHNYKNDKVDTTDQYHRFRQKDPSEFDESTFRTIKFTDGLKAIVGKIKTKSISIELPALQFSSDRIKTIVGEIVGGGK
jgi:hypothetical protein